MGQEYFINSQELQQKVDNLLPSQGGAGAGFDLSASTQIIPIIDLTESAEGSNVRQDLQTAFTFTNTTRFTISNTSTTIITNPGYWRVFGTASHTGTTSALFNFNDGATDKFLLQFTGRTGGADFFDFIVALASGDSFIGTSGGATTSISVAVRQIATIDGTLINPL